MKSNRLQNYSGNYIHGFKEVRRHESAKQTLIGLVKILSYALIIPPVILGCIYLKNKKITQYQSRVDEAIDEGRLPEIFANNIGEGNGIVQYLINKLANFELNDNEESEKERFQEVFKTMNSGAQADFFIKAQKTKWLPLAIKWLPDDLSELNFISGPNNPIQHSKINARSINLLLNELSRFTSLKKISLNLHGVGFYNRSVDSDIQAMSQPGVELVNAGDSQTVFNFKGTTYNFSNNTLPFIKTIVSLKTLIEKNPELEWQIHCTGFSCGGHGTLVTIAANGEDGFSEHLAAYLTK